jgi:ABC-type maltose transport system permease subunit
MLRLIFLVLQHLLTSGLAMGAVFVSALISTVLIQALRGRNYSDVGVLMYENEELARAVGLQRTLSSNLPWLPYAAAAITCVCFRPILLIFLSW